MHPIEYNELQARAIANLIKNPDNLRILHTLTGGKPREYFTDPHLVFYDAIQLLNDKKATVSVEWVVWTVKNSRAGKEWSKTNGPSSEVLDKLDLTEKSKRFMSDEIMISIVDVLEYNIKRFFNEPVNFSALVGRMINSKPTRAVLPPLPIERCVLSKRQIGFLEVARKQLKKDKWNEVKKHLGIRTSGIQDLSRAEASALIDYIKKENLLDGTK